MTIPVRWLTPQLAIAGQIDPQNLPELAEMGFKAIICNRPDHEYGPGQPTAESIQEAAQALGLQFAHHPVAGDGGTAEDAMQMGMLMSRLPGPILSYCYSGGRCIALISLAARLGQPIPK